MRQNETAEMGMNKTGMATAPRLSKEMVESSSNGSVASSDGARPDAVRLDYVRQGATLGSVPPPLSIKGAAKTALQAMQGRKAIVLIDKLAERLAFERTGTRLYEALMLKCKSLEGTAQRDTLQKLEHICCEELEHFQMLWKCIEDLGGDPTVQTPSADAAGVASQGIPKVLLDPRTTFAQCLEAIMIAELADGDAWDRLTDLADGFKQTEMAQRFRQALAEEKEHQGIIRGLISRQAEEEAGISPGST